MACLERAAADAGLQPTAEHAVVALYPHSTDQMSCLGAAEMGQATRRELALGLRSPEASLASTRGRSRWRRGGAGGFRVPLVENNKYMMKRPTGKNMQLHSEHVSLLVFHT